MTSIRGLGAGAWGQGPGGRDLGVGAWGLGAGAWGQGPGGRNLGVGAWGLEAGAWGSDSGVGPGGLGVGAWGLGVRSWVMVDRICRCIQGLEESHISPVAPSHLQQERLG